MEGRFLNGFAPKFAFAFIMVALCFPILSRSLWIDEVMLLSNYPLAHFSDLLRPLPFYDQASTPLYSVILTFAAWVHPVALRSGLLFGVSFALISILLIGEKSWKKHAFGLVVFWTIPIGIYMMSELKHYALESVGAMIALIWLLRKDLSKALTIRDVLTLLLAVACGASTIVIGTVTVACFVWLKFREGRQFVTSEILYLGLYLLITLAYYMVIARATAIQTANYPEAYSNRGVFGNLANLRNAFFSCYGRFGMATVGVGAVLLTIRGDQLSKKLLMLSGITLSAFVVLCAIGKYPAAYDRHVTWSAAIAIAVLYFGITPLFERRNWKVMGIAVTVLLCGMGARKISTFWLESTEKVDNNRAIEFISSLPPADIGVWFASQPTIKYYSKIHPELTRHHYFGLVNDSSKANELARDSIRLASEDIERIRKEPGAWGRVRKYWTSNEYELPAQSLFQEAPRNKKFYLFFSHYSIKGPTAFYRAHASAIHGQMEKNNCAYSVLKEFHYAYIYQVFCPE